MVVGINPVTVEWFPCNLHFHCYPLPNYPGLFKDMGKTEVRRRGGWGALAGNGSFRPRVVSALSRFGPGLFRPGSFRPNLVGRFGLFFFSTIRLVTEGQLNTL